MVTKPWPVLLTPPERMVNEGTYSVLISIEHVNEDAVHACVCACVRVCIF